MKIFHVIVILGLVSCEKKPVGTVLTNSSEFRAEEQTTITAQELPEAFEQLVRGIIEAMPEERKAEIRKAESAEMMIDHFGMGMELRNGELNQRGSEVVNYLTRMGIYHREDYSGIVLVSVNRRLRGEPINLMAQIQELRDYWSKRDIVAPLDLACPSCGKEMEVVHLGKGVSDVYSERTYFHGRCPTHEGFIYYHSDGWVPWSAPMPEGEQDADDNHH